jgi:hypothetical protein
MTATLCVPGIPAQLIGGWDHNCERNMLNSADGEGLAAKRLGFNANGSHSIATATRGHHFNAITYRQT